MSPPKGLVYPFPAPEDRCFPDPWPKDCPHLEDTDEHACSRRFGWIFSQLNHIMGMLVHDDPSQPIGLRVSMIANTLRHQTRILYLILAAILAALGAVLFR